MTAPWTTVWFYNSDTGSVVSEPAFGDTIQAHLPGWHGPFGTKAEALAYYQQNAASHSGWKAPTGLAGNLGNAVSTVAGGAVKSVLGDGFHLVFGNTSGLLGRILKVAFGVILIVAGVLKLSGTDKKLEQVIPVVGGAAGKVLMA
jgi:hypothetical protein